MDEGIENLFTDNVYDVQSLSKTEDLFHVVGAIYDSMNIKVAFILFITFIILNTDIFADNCLRKISANSYDLSQDKITGKGVMLSAMILSVFYIFIDILSAKKII